MTQALSRSDSGFDSFLHSLTGRLTRLEEKYKWMESKAVEVLHELYEAGRIGYVSNDVVIGLNDLNNLVVLINGERVEYDPQHGILHGSPKTILENKDYLVRLGKAILECNREAENLKRVLERAEELSLKLGNPGIYEEIEKKIREYLEKPRLVEK